MYVQRKITSLFLLYLFHVVFGTFKDSDIQELFRESKCIEEPTDDYFDQYLARESQSKINDYLLSANHDIENRKNYRNEINSLILHHNLENSYDLVDEKGPAHSKIFNISLSLGDEIYYGVGKSKKEAKEMAARSAFENTLYQKPSPKIIDGKAENEELTPTVLLNNLGAKHGYQISYYILTRSGSKRIINLNKVKDKSFFTNSSFWKEAAHLDEPPKSPFHIEVNVENKSWYGKANTIQEAKHNAAAKAIQSLKAQENLIGPCGAKGHEAECKEAKNRLKSPISLIYEFAQLERLDVEFNELSQSGLAHKPIFEYECLLGTFRTSAEGKSKKEAKRIAAQKMLERIPQLDFSNQSESKSKTHKSKKLKNSEKKSESTLDVAADFVKNAINFFSSNEIDDEYHEHGGDSKQPNEATRRSQRKKRNENKNRWSPKERLLNAGKSLRLNIQFHSIPGKNSGYHSLIYLDLNPKYICIGSGTNIEISQEYSALNALKFLYKLDLLDNIDEKDLDIERFSFDNYIWLTEDFQKND